MFCPGKKRLHRKLFLVLGLCILFFWIFAAEARNPLISLSKEERAWLKEHPTLRVGVGVAFPPYMWVEKKDGHHIFKGMIAEYLDLLAGKLGLDMQIVFDTPFDEALNMGKRGQIDFFPCLSKTPGRSEYLLFTEPYLSYPMAIITREEAPLSADWRI